MGTGEHKELLLIGEASALLPWSWSRSPLLSKLLHGTMISHGLPGAASVWDGAQAGSKTSTQGRLEQVSLLE